MSKEKLFLPEDLMNSEEEAGWELWQKFVRYWNESGSDLIDNNVPRERSSEDGGGTDDGDVLG